MKIAGILFVVGTAGALFLQEREAPVTDAERTRFLFHAVFEGLVVDGAQETVVKKIAERRDEWFVPKCPICDAVGSGFQAYLAYAQVHGWKCGRDDGFPDWFGPGWTKETVDTLNHADVKRRHAALQALVERYVSRRFDTLKMSDERRDRMRESLKIGMGNGIKELKESGFGERFPSSCPSCEGAN